MERRRLRALADHRSLDRLLAAHFYGFLRDNGHAFLTPVEGDFTASATVTGKYEQLYDQAGLMLRVDERNSIKTGIEYTDGLMHFSVVVTREVSDWSVIPLPGAKRLTTSSMYG